MKKRGMVALIQQARYLLRQTITAAARQAIWIITLRKVSQDICPGLTCFLRQFKVLYIKRSIFDQIKAGRCEGLV